MRLGISLTLLSIQILMDNKVSTPSTSVKAEISQAELLEGTVVEDFLFVGFQKITVSIMLVELEKVVSVVVYFIFLEDLLVAYEVNKVFHLPYFGNVLADDLYSDVVDHLCTA